MEVQEKRQISRLIFPKIITSSFHSTYGVQYQFTQWVSTVLQTFSVELVPSIKMFSAQKITLLQIYSLNENLYFPLMTKEHTKHAVEIDIFRQFLRSVLQKCDNWSRHSLYCKWTWGKQLWCHTCTLKTGKVFCFTLSFSHYFFLLWTDCKIWLQLYI